MHHTVAIAASLASLGLACAMYYCNILARPTSWPRSEMITMILLSLFIGLFPLALGASLIGLWQILSGGLSLTALVSAAADLFALAAIAATSLVVRNLVKATYRKAATPGSVTPLTPRPANSGHKPSTRKLAA